MKISRQLIKGQLTLSNKTLQANNCSLEANKTEKAYSYLIRKFIHILIYIKVNYMTIATIFTTILIKTKASLISVSVKSASTSSAASASSAS